jgi:hypothetical protein
MSDRMQAKAAVPKASPAIAAQSVRPAITPVRTALLQRACACGQLPTGKCDDCDKKEKGKTVQRASAGGPAPATVPPIVNQALGTSGQPLDTSTRTFMESRFGHDFGSVRVHNDSLASESARAVNAKAYTVGKDIVFDRGLYNPGTEGGDHLLAHELAHTIQQHGIQRFSEGPIYGDSPEYTRLEKEAGATADAVMRGGTVSLPSLMSGPLVQRVPWSEAFDDKKCPTGTSINPLRSALIDPKTNKPPKDIKDITVATIAEEKIVDYYLQQHSGDMIATGGITKGGAGRKLLETLPGKDPMLVALKKEFHSGKSSFPGRTKSIADPEIAVPPNQEGEAESHYEQVKGAYAQREEGAEMYKRPDIMNITARRVFDVTTVGETPGKVTKIKNVYVKLLEDIRTKEGVGGDAWQAGLDGDLEVPPKRTLLYRYSGTNVICYGPTDLSTYPGVISYVALDLGAQAVDATGEPYEISIKGQTITIMALPSPSDTDLLNSGAQNKAFAESVKGVILKTLHRKKSGPDVIDGVIETAGDSKDPNALPIDIAEKKETVQLLVDKKTRELTQKKDKKISIPFDFKPMSKGAITQISISQTEGLSGKGYIKPSIPFLKQLDFTFAPGVMTIGKSLGPGDLKSPFPSVRISEASLGIQLSPFKPEGKVGFQFGPEGKPPLAQALFSASTDGKGFVATGNLKLSIPGVDKAESDFTYKGGGEYGEGFWTGKITIESSQIDLPYIESGSLVVQMAPGKGIDVDGKLNLKFPGDNTATVGLRRTETAWLLTGGGKFNVPKVGPVRVSVVYNTSNKYLVAEAKDIEFKIFDLTANLRTLTVELRPGHNPVFYGSGSVALKKGKVDGHAELTLNKNGKFTGKGTVKYRFNENLEAAASVELDDKERLKFSGEITITSIKLFDAFGDTKELFSVDFSIGIPGLSIGGIGLELRVGGGATVGYSVGPGTIAPLKFEAGFYPLEEQSDLSLGLSGSLNIPATAFLEANVHADIVLDAFIAEVGGGVKVTGTIKLKGGLFVPFSGSFKQGKIEAELNPELKFALLLGLALSIRAWAKAGFGWLSVKTSKEWILAQREIDTGLGFSFKAPIKYSSDKGATLPSFNQVEVKKPDISKEKLKSILSQLVSGADEKEV